MDPDLDQGGPKTYESYGFGSGFGSSTLVLNLSKSGKGIFWLFFYV
jgi:hypothetical protein